MLKLQCRIDTTNKNYGGKVMQKTRAEKDKRYEDKHKEERKASVWYGERAYRERKPNRLTIF